MENGAVTMLDGMWVLFLFCFSFLNTVHRECWTENVIRGDNDDFTFLRESIKFIHFSFDLNYFVDLNALSDCSQSFFICFHIDLDLA